MTDRATAAQDAFFDAVPDTPYEPCPCGCGRKWKFVLQDHPEEHYQRFVDEWRENGQKEAST